MTLALGTRTSSNAHLAIDGADGESGAVPFDDEGRHAVVGAGVDGPGLGEDAVPVGLADPGHPAFGAGEDPVVTVGSSVGADAHDVAARLGLGEPERGAGFAGGDRRDEAPLLVFAAGDEHRAGGEPGEEQHEGRGLGVLRYFLDREREPEDSGSGATERFGDAEAGQGGVDEELE